MQLKQLQWKRVIRMILFILLLNVAGITKANNVNENLENDTTNRAANYDFYAECPSHQVLYYKITDTTLRYVKMTYPYSYNGTPWQSFVEPTGNITLPETVTYNGITYTVTEIGDYTFNKCHGLTGTIEIPNTVKIIGQFTFANCKSLTSLVLCNSLTTIKYNAFYHCSGLTGSLVIPNSVTEIQHHAFSGCTSFNGTLTLPEGLQTIGYRAFEGCSGFTGSLIIPSTVTSVGQYAFLNCSGFNGNLLLSDQMSALDISVFKGCSGLVGDLVIPKAITTISNEALSGCSQLGAIYICGNSVPTKGSENNSFYGISKNIPIYVPYCLVDDYNQQWSVFSFTNYKGRSFFNAEGDWSDTDNWACGETPSEDMNVIVAANCNMDETASVTSLTLLKRYTLSIMPEMALNSYTITNKGTAANFIIQDGGQLYHNNANVQATVMKTITAYDSQSNGWHLISSPLTSNTGVNMVDNLLSNEYDLYYYDEPTFYWINQKNAENNFTELASGKGYLYANSESITLGFAGALKNGNASVTISPLSFQGTNLKGFNLVGNPYAHNVTAYSTVNVDEEGCYRMNPAKNDLIISEISEESPLQPAEGFFVLATGENASISFNSAKTRDEVTRTGSIYVELCEDGLTTDRLIVKRSEEDHNLAKLSLSDNRTKLFASKDNQELAIVVCNGSNEQPVNFKTNKNGNYTINVSVNDLDLDYLHLIDNLTGEDVDLLATPSYSFDARITDYASRFRLVFEPNANEENNDSFAFISDGSFIIANEGTATLQVIDMTGRILSSETIYDSFTKPINLSDGVYVLRLINGDNVKTQKIVVR